MDLGIGLSELDRKIDLYRIETRNADGWR